MNIEYVHGYNHRENIRLQDQASTLVELLHSDTSYPVESHVLEAGCGVGAQTVTLAKNGPNALITSVDISAASVTEAKEKVVAAGLTNVQFVKRIFSICLMGRIPSTIFSSVSFWNISRGLSRHCKR